MQSIVGAYAENIMTSIEIMGHQPQLNPHVIIAIIQQRHLILIYASSIG
jgi:hypothetical protein